jgi:imidazoleglycerol-phosphate dehydratase
VGIVLGQALKTALGDKRGIRRFGSAYVPMDEALGFTALDFSGRAFLVYDAEMPQEKIGDYDSCLTKEFMAALANHAGITLHQKVLYGDNAHHMTEALFKSLGLAVKQAVYVEGGEIPSTKGVL